MTNYIIILLILVLDILATKKIFNYRLMDKKAKRTNYILIWILPLIWACIILLFPFDPPKRDKNFEKHRYMDSGYPKPHGIH